MLGRFKEQLGGLCRRAVGGGVCRPCVRGVGKPGFCDAEGHGKSCRFPLKEVRAGTSDHLLAGPLVFLTLKKISSVGAYYV